MLQTWAMGLLPEILGVCLLGTRGDLHLRSLDASVFLASEAAEDTKSSQDVQEGPLPGRGGGGEGVAHSSYPSSPDGSRGRLHHSV